MEPTLTEAQRPIVAILTVDDGANFFRGNRANFLDIIRTGRKMSFIVYIVTVKDLKLSSNRIIGFTYHENGYWHKQWFPLPRVIYNRIPTREDELSPKVQRKLNACLRHPTIQLFNPAYFNKWTLFEWLKGAKTTRKYIPATRRLTNQNDLGKLLKTHSFVYLKPERGKAGRGIMRVSQMSSTTLPYRLSIQENKGSMTYKCATLTKLWSKIGKVVAGRDYIMQQGIDLARIDRRPFDLRVLVQKNRKGQWDITGIGARLAGSYSITTHVPRGGSIEDPNQLLSKVFGDNDARKIMLRTKTASLLISKQIERGAGQSLGEMSIDLGIDREGNVWFFEANAKPMKFDEPHIRKKSLERLFHYSLYLNKYKSAKMGGA